jgi:sulfite reductase alpha subunit-like flavoprotein
MTRDDLVKELKKAEQRQAATKYHHISISLPATEEVFRAGDALQLWDMAYAAGVAAEKARCAALCSEVAAGRDAEAIEEAILARGKK